MISRYLFLLVLYVCSIIEIGFDMDFFDVDLLYVLDRLFLDFLCVGFFFFFLNKIWVFLGERLNI